MSEKSIPIPKELPILPVRDTVLFPGGVQPLTVGREGSLALLNSLHGDEKLLGIVAQHDPRVEEPAAADLHLVGTAAKIHKLVRMPNGNVVVFLEGLQRIRVVELVSFRPFLTARVEIQPDLVGDQDAELMALERNARELFRDVVARSPQLSDDLQTAALNIEDPVRLADFIAANLPSLPTLLRQELLETADVRRRLETLIRELSKELEVLELRNKIQEQVQEQVSQSQREYLLREQLKAIHKELGESDDGQAEIDELREKLEKSGMSAEARKECDRELKRLAKMTPASAEYMVARTYLEWMISLPWAKSSGLEEIDIPKGQAILDEDHYDLEKVKERILDYLAVKKLKPGMKGPILCFLGPPGVGKTSLGKSIARALGRKFVRISMGGMHDEAEIRGHRRTYIGALPGQIIQGIRRAETNDPVFMLDEVDKLGRDFRGDPSAALMEVLDPEQNGSFRDHYLDVPFDLSKVLFIATANMIDPVPEPLRDRMEIIELAGYIEIEKIQIANKYLVPKQAEEHGLKVGEQIEFTDDGLREIIHSYTREAGVRNLEREIATLIRKQARRIAEGKTEKLVVTPEVVHEALGVPKYPRRKGSRGTRQDARSFGRTRLDAFGRRHRLHRGEPHARRKAVHHDRASGRSDAGVDDGSADVGSRQRRTLRHRSRLLPEAGHPHPRAVGRGAERWSFGRRGDGQRAGELALRPAHPPARGHDGRDFALRHRSAGRRDQGKSAGSETRRNPRGDFARGERAERERGPAAAHARRDADSLRAHGG